MIKPITATKLSVFLFLNCGHEDQQKGIHPIKIIIIKLKAKIHQTTSVITAFANNCFTSKRRLTRLITPKIVRRMGNTVRLINKK